MFLFSLDLCLSLSGLYTSHSNCCLSFSANQIRCTQSKDKTNGIDPLDPEPICRSNLSLAVPSDHEKNPSRTSGGRYLYSQISGLFRETALGVNSLFFLSKGLSPTLTSKRSIQPVFTLVAPRPHSLSRIIASLSAALKLLRFRAARGRKQGTWGHIGRE